MSLDGGGWRLPDIWELRSLIRDCLGTVLSADECYVGTGGCLSSYCYGGGLCQECEMAAGPTPAGCYRPDEINGPCVWHKSSTYVEDIGGNVWSVYYHKGALGNTPVSADGTGVMVRCVR